LLWQRYGLKGIGTDDDSHQQLYSELLGRDASAEFSWINKAEDLPLAELLAKFGVELKLRSSSSNADQGGGDVDGLAIGFGAKY
ncbi:peptidase M61, partial [Shewanella sp. A25]|nr:peptidase M61 [Shewanella shenzhenensis]